jgi:hypothetical protein
MISCFSQGILPEIFTLSSSPKKCGQFEDEIERKHFGAANPAGCASHFGEKK